MFPAVPGGDATVVGVAAGAASGAGTGAGAVPARMAEAGMVQSALALPVILSSTGSTAAEVWKTTHPVWDWPAASAPKAVYEAQSVTL